MLGWSRRSRATAVTPSSRGMCRSMTTASGDSSSASSIAARPSSAWPTTASSGWRSISGRSASRNGWSSSARRTRIMAAASAVPIRRKLALSAMSMQLPRRATIIGAALDLGAGRRGVDMGPSAIRYAGLDSRISELGYDVDDRGNVGTAVAEAIGAVDEHARFLPQIKETCRHIADIVAEAAGTGSTPLVLGGDHSVALGTLGGLHRVHGPGGVIWIDAHGDLNSPETSPSGNVHGMVLAAAIGRAGERFQGDGWDLPALVPG